VGTAITASAMPARSVTGEPDGGPFGRVASRLSVRNISNQRSVTLSTLTPILVRTPIRNVVTQCPPKLEFVGFETLTGPNA
jgi:hypothetical protein